MLALALAGCLGMGGGDDASAGTSTGDSQPDRGLAIQRHDTASEHVTASIGTVTGDVTYDDLVVTVSGAPSPYTFGGDASFREAKYGVGGVSDASSPVRQGNLVTIPASGSVTVTFTDSQSGETWATFSAEVPDKDPPPTPTNVAPADGASKVSRTPTFKWKPVADPSGATYTLEVSLDKNFGRDLVVQKHQDISSTSYQPGGDNKLAPGQTYYWHVRAVDSQGNTGSWSPTWSFTTKPR